ncbi:MAG: hypothetical protein C4326_07525 [Ignavibacteria bacterium]
MTRSSRWSVLHRAPAALPVLLLSAYVFAVWVWSAETPTTSFNGDPRSKLSDLIYGTAHKPYVYRALVPMLTRSIHSLVAGPALDSLEQAILRHPKVQKETKRLGWEKDFFVEYLIALALAFGALVGFAFALRRLWTLLYATDDAIARIAPLLALLALPPIFPTGPHYIYDFPALFLFTAGMVLIAQERWNFFYPLFVIGCVNKEAMFLLSFLFLVWFRKRMHTPTLLFHLTAQVLLFAVVRTAIMYTFADNPGESLPFQLYPNLHFALMGYNLTTLLYLALLVWLVAHDLRHKHPFLTAALMLTVPFGILVLLSGVLSELRAVYELFPVLFLLVLHTILFSLLRKPYVLRTLPDSSSRVP